mmetsp:Transcript_20115/g.47092  ORF Transcript_20115/g.47092 Transcript_20115/m.47092 type:complete len:542 (-) Transcript_20115:235-1860(-)
MRVVLFSCFDLVHLVALLCQHWQSGVQAHEDRQAVGSVRDIARPHTRFVRGQLVLDCPPVVRVLTEVVEDLDHGCETWPNAETSKVFSLDTLRSSLDGAPRVAVDPVANQLFEAVLLVHPETRPGANGLDEDLGVNLLAIFRVNSLVSQALQFIHNALHQLVVPSQEVNVGNAKNGLLLYGREAALTVLLHRIASPNVIAYQVVHPLEGVQEHQRRQGPCQGPHQPRRHLGAAKVTRTAQHPALLAAVLAKRPDILDGECPVAVQHADLLHRHVVVDVVEGAVLNVAAKVLLAGEVCSVRFVEETRPSAHVTCEHDVRVTLVLIHWHVLDSIVSSLGYNPFYVGIEPHVVIEAVRFRSLAHHGQKEVTRGPSLVLHVSYHLRHWGPRQRVLDAVSPPLGLQLGELVGHLDPRMATKVVVPVHANDVPSVFQVQINHTLDASKASPDHKNGMIPMVRLALKSLDSADENCAGALLVELLHSGSLQSLSLDGDGRGVGLEEHGEQVPHLTDLGAGLSPNRHALVGALYVNSHSAVREALRAPT